MSGRADSPTRKLARRLALTYAASIVVISCLFLLGAIVFARMLSYTLAERMQTAAAQVDAFFADGATRSGKRADIVPLLRSRAFPAGVAVRIAREPRGAPAPPPRPPRPDAAPAEPASPAMPLGEPPPPPEPPLIGRTLDTLATLALGERPIRRRYAGFAVDIEPRPSAMGAPFVAFFAETSLLAAGLIALVALAAREMALRSLAPLKLVDDALGQLAEGDFAAHRVTMPEGGDLRALVGNYNRATERVAAAIAERAKNERRMRRFVADAGHELRTPLTIVMGYVDVLQSHPPSDPAVLEGIYAKIRAEGGRMRTLVHHLAMLTMIEENAPATIDVVDAREFAEEIVETMRALDPRGRMRVREGEAAAVLANVAELGEALRILLDNALKYAPEGPIDVVLGREGEFGTLEVRDLGPGIAAEDLPHIFERFYRGEQRGRAQGSGLGLSVALRAVERAGGTLEYRAGEPRGARFVCRVPLCRFE